MADNGIGGKREKHQRIESVISRQSGISGIARNSMKIANVISAAIGVAAANKWRVMYQAQMAWRRNSEK